MTKQVSEADFSLQCRRFAAAGMLLASAALAGCASDPMAPRVAGARDTETYPNLNIVPQGETEQFTPAERAATTGELALARASARAQANSLSGAGGDQAQLRRIGDTHAQEALEEIGAE